MTASHDPASDRGSILGPTLRFKGELSAGEDLVIHGQVDIRRGFYDRNRVRVIHGNARFIDPHTIEVESPSGARPSGSYPD